MPPMDNLPPADPTTLQWCEQVAARVHLVHVTSGRVGRPMFWDVADGEIPTSAVENGYCGEGARFAEEQCGYPPSVYFYVGRANPRYGQAALAFGPEVEDERFHSATPFDSGSVVNRTPETAMAVDLGLPADALIEEQIRVRAEYCKTATVATDWRAVFARWLAAYFPSGCEGYWERRPETSDPEGLYTRNPDSDWAAWTWEVRYARGPVVTAVARWTADPTHLREISRFLADAQPRPEVVAAFEVLFTKLEAPSGRANFCEELEQWVRRTCL